MAQNTHIDGLPQGPWLSEEEIQAILHIDSDAEFDRIMAARRRNSIVRWLWAAGVAASVVVAVMITPPQPSPTEEGVELSHSTAKATPTQDDVPNRAASASQPVTTHASVWNKTNNTSCAGTRLNPNSNVDTNIEDILIEADMAFDRADRVCEGMIIAADCEFEPEEDENDASVIYI